MPETRPAGARLREHLIAALARRAQSQQGAARADVEARIARLRAASPPEPVARESAVVDPATAGPLRRLLADLADDGRGPRLVAPAPAPATAPRGPARTRRPESAPPAPAPRAEPESLQYFRRTWSRLSAEQRVAQSLSALPGNAGPLHSQQLLHRALLLMREVAPDYLERFVTQVDTLLWLESANAQVAAGPAPAPARSAAERRVTRGRPG